MAVPVTKEASSDARNKTAFENRVAEVDELAKNTLSEEDFALEYCIFKPERIFNDAPINIDCLVVSCRLLYPSGLYDSSIFWSLEIKNYILAVQHFHVRFVRRHALCSCWQAGCEQKDSKTNCEG